MSLNARQWVVTYSLSCHSVGLDISRVGLIFINGGAGPGGGGRGEG